MQYYLYPLDEVEGNDSHIACHYVDKLFVGTQEECVGEFYKDMCKNFTNRIESYKPENISEIKVERNTRYNVIKGKDFIATEFVPPGNFVKRKPYEKGEDLEFKPQTVISYAVSGGLNCCFSAILFPVKN